MEANAPDAVIQEFADDAEARTALELGRVDAYVTDYTLLLNSIVKNPGTYQLAGDVFGNVDPYGIGLPKDSDGVVAEVLRSGVNAVPKGQAEAAQSLGMQDSHMFRKIVFPQAFRFVIPALIAELVIVLKDTTFAYVVNYADLMQNAKVLISNYDALVFKMRGSWPHQIGKPKKSVV